MTVPAASPITHFSDLYPPLIDAAVDAIVIIDNDGRIALWNQAAERIFGYSAEEAMGQSLHELVTPARFRAASDAAFKGFRESGIAATRPRTRDLAGLRRNGEEFPLELSLSAMLHEGKWVAFGIARDISERKRFEEQVHTQLVQIESMNATLSEANKQLGQAQSQALQSEKLASIGLLAAGVAHEINNPVGYVFSNLGSLESYLTDIFDVLEKYEALEKSVPAGAPTLLELGACKSRIDLDYLRTDIKALLAESREGLMRVKQIVLDLKDFSRTGADEEWTWANLHDGINSTLGVVWNQLKYKCEVRKEFGVLPPVQCLPTQLNQVLMNLLVNAAQAIENRGIVTIRTGQEGDQVWIEISDTGKGIPESEIGRIFDPFFTTKPVGLGTGLGLSVSHTIIEKHHGKIVVSSVVGSGSNFRVWLPVDQRSFAGRAAGSDNSSDLRGGN